MIRRTRLVSGSTGCHRVTPYLAHDSGALRGEIPSHTARRARQSSECSRPGSVLRRITAIFECSGPSGWDLHEPLESSNVLVLVLSCHRSRCLLIIAGTCVLGRNKRHHIGPFPVNDRWPLFTLTERRPWQASVGRRPPKPPNARTRSRRTNSRASRNLPLPLRRAGSRPREALARNRVACRPGRGRSVALTASPSSLPCDMTSQVLPLRYPGSSQKFNGILRRQLSLANR